MTSPHKVTWRRCFAAALQKNALLRGNAYMTTFLELLMPSLFMLLLSIGYWLSDDDSSPAQGYADTLINISAAVYDSSIFCSFNTEYAPAGIPNCNDLITRDIPWDIDFDWLVVGGSNYMINPDIWGMYVTNMTVAEGLVALLADLDKSFTIPDLDSYLIIQGLVSKIFSVGFPLEKNPKASLSHGGYLAIASSDPRITDAFTAYCSNISYYCDAILFETVFESLDAARDYAYRNGNSFWAILDLTAIDYDVLYHRGAGANGNSNATTYTISMNYTATPWTFQTVLPFTTGLGRKEYLLYLGSGFLTLQQLANTFIFSLVQASPHASPGTLPLNESKFYDTLGMNRIAAAPMPTRAYYTSQFLVQSGEFIPLVMTFAMLYGLSRTLSGIVEEKEGKVREAMLIMGLPLSAFYMSWLATAMLVNAVACIGSTVVLKLTLFNAVDPLIMWIVNYSFSLTVMSVAMLISVFFSKPRIAAIVGPLIMFVSTVPYYAIPVGTPQAYIVAASVLPCTAYAQAINAFVSYAQNGYGVTWTNAFEGDYSIALAVFMMLLDTAVYLLMGVYLDLVLPSEHGTQRHPLFFVHELQYWWRARRSQRTMGPGPTVGSLDDDQGLASAPLLSAVVAVHQNPTDVVVMPDSGTAVVSASVSPIHDKHLHQAFHPPTPCIVKVDGLVKTYAGEGEPIRAVRGISLNLHQGHIHALLGHNGAGKSTTINMLVGLVPPTQGTIEICGLSIASKLSTIRQNLGYCPQHNIIWAGLTVAQHLRVYARLKSPSWNVEHLVASTLALVQLEDKRNAAAGSLSGGQKRKLCVGISLIGGSPFLLLDEPTAGMDVEARRAMWDMLLKIRRERCILLSTHFMDEADLLGDHIAIMSHGRIHSSGTPLFLKSKLGIGYSVTCIMDHEQRVADAVAFLEEAYRNAAQDQPYTSATPQHTTMSDPVKRGKEVVVRLPMSFTAVAGRVFEALENAQHRLHILSFGLSLTTMEDVFLSIALLGDVEAAQEEAAEEAAKEHDVLGHDKAATGSTLPLAAQDIDRYAPILNEDETRSLHRSRRTFGRHFVAMFCKRFHCAKRDRRMLCFQVIMPIVFLCIALLVLLLHPPEQPALVLNGGMYGRSTEVLVSPVLDHVNPNASLYPSTGPYSLEALFDGSAFRSVYTPQFVDACDDLGTSSLCLSQLLAEQYNTHNDPRYVALAPITTNTGGNTLFPSTTSTVFHNATAPHSLPEVMAMATNLAYQNLNQWASASIVVVNYPLTLSEAQQVLINAIRRIVSAIFILIPFTFVPANYVCFVVKEKECKAKHLQWVAGGNMLAFWISSLVWDLLTFLATELLCIAVFFAFKRDEFIGDAETFAATFCLFFMYGLASIPFSYVLSFAFKNSSSAQNITMMGNFFAGFLLVMAAQILSTIDSTKEINAWLCKFYRIVPAYALGEGIITLTGRSLASYVTGDNEASPFDLLDFDNKRGGFFGGVGTSLCYLGAAAPFFFILLLVLEGGRSLLTRLSLSRVRNQPNEEEVADYGPEDDAVLAERREAEAVHEEPSDDAPGNPRVVHGRPGDGVTIQRLRKAYAADKIAVKDLSIGVGLGETFALLGTNGAGKTTTISTLTGEHVPTCGDAFINGRSIVKEMHEARQWIGYCPQFDALHEHMTPREHLTLYCRLRGLTPAEVTEQVAKTIDALSLGKYADTMAKSLSGGNKRKLSLGIALIGDTKVILLDEPTAGMDPVARRDLWKSLALVAKGRSIVLTTHHLEEVEALADRVGIMVGGKMMGLGTLQQLKSKYVGNVFDVHMSFAPPRGQTTNTARGDGSAVANTSFGASNDEEIRNAEATVSFFRGALAQGVEVSVAEMNGNKLTISVEGAPLSALFRATELRKVALEAAYEAEEAEATQRDSRGSGAALAGTGAFVRRITEYALSQATLEQVFLRIGILARQEEADAHHTAPTTTGAIAPPNNNEIRTPALPLLDGGGRRAPSYGAAVDLS